MGAESTRYRYPVCPVESKHHWTQSWYWRQVFFNEQILLEATLSSKNKKYPKHFFILDPDPNYVSFGIFSKEPWFGSATWFNFFLISHNCILDLKVQYCCTDWNFCWHWTSTRIYIVSSFNKQNDHPKSGSGCAIPVLRIRLHGHII